MASNLLAAASNLLAAASNLIAMASNLIAMASNLRYRSEEHAIVEEDLIEGVTLKEKKAATFSSSLPYRYPRLGAFTSGQNYQ